MQYREISYSSGEEWLNLRKKGIGGSDAGVIIGKNKFKNIILSFTTYNTKPHLNNEFTTNFSN